MALLRQIGITPDVIPSSVEEEFDGRMNAVENALRLASAKAREVARGVDDALVLGADTIVLLDGVMLAKPADSADAVHMLRQLSGRTHEVVTAFCIVDQPSGGEITDYERTQVTFRRLPDEEIREYVAGGSPLDKAGAYGIQDDYGAVFVSRIDGCFYTVVGLPLVRVYLALKTFESHNVKPQRT
jgi:septum formation protein